MAEAGPKKTVEVDKDHLSCCICLNLLSVPKLLQCCHTFCRKCLQKYIEKQEDASHKKGFDCPVCRQFTAIPNPMAGWADQIVTDFRIQAMIDDSPESGGKQGVTSEVSANDREFILVEVINGKTSQDEKNPKVTDIVVLMQEDKDVIVIADGNNCCVKAFWMEPYKDREMSCRLIINEMIKNSLGRIAKINETQIFLTAFHCQTLYIITVNNGLSIHTTIDTGKFNLGNGVISAKTPSIPETRLAIGYSKGLSIMDMDGSVVRNMDISNDGQNYTNDPWYLAITPACNILVSDRNDCLLCVTQKREVLWKYPTKTPAGLDCDVQGNIYLAICDENKVVLMSPDGEFINDVLSADNIKKPRGIWYDSVKKRLYVAELDGLIKVFEHKQ
ncbi:uncharacterized protein LOC121367057 isoform X2 [Gigantopelta aegis]|nr:uncharacterized protein LOC121367057 isoform X2 [Gigantopelta aegis]XP_041347176.1 uncharacterized protein LOC121367057 isoform X2 [Gigantopelta aegis]XP_041347177.1 uncharacterized protein LOC121367057 isoform X2 [Gigantopelta aegis]